MKENAPKPFDRKDPNFYICQAGNPFIMGTFTGDLVLKKWRDYRIANRQEKGLPEKRRSFVHWLDDQISVWESKRELKNL